MLLHKSIRNRYVTTTLVSYKSVSAARQGIRGIKTYPCLFDIWCNIREHGPAMRVGGTPYNGISGFSLRWPLSVPFFAMLIPYSGLFSDFRPFQAFF
jgi:hypothetical protein